MLGLVSYDSDEEETLAKKLAEEKEAAKEAADAALAAQSTSESEEEEDEEDEEEGVSGKVHTHTHTTEKKKSLLPSVDDLFASTETPAFLKEKKETEHQVELIEDKRQHESRKRKFEQRKGAQTQQQTATHTQSYKRPPAGVVPPGASHHQPSEAPRPPPPPSRHPEKKQERDRNAKERVKEQRLKGQSGIGSDFRSWKSDAEMVMRQQYD